jgi:2,4-diaminopentanoate dehydrogenase
MSQNSYRVIQWATGTVGKASLQHFIENPAFELVGVLVTNPDKVGKDAGELVGLAPTGVLATNDVEKIIALDADCVHFAPLVQDIDMVCRLLRSGKNVVSTLGPFYPTEHFRADVEKIEAACQDGGTSFHGCGIHPGFVGDILPLTLTRLMNRIDRIEVYEIADKLRNPSVYIEFMGFGLDPAELSSKPNCMEGAAISFAQSMAVVVEGLGKTIENLTERHEVATAKHDIAYPGGVIRAGTVAGQHWEWTAWAAGAPLIVYHLYYVMGDDMEPAWNLGDSRHRIVIEGDPPLELTLMASADADGRHPFLGITWTALLGCTAVPAVCAAKPGMVTHLDLGVVQPRGVVRPPIS